MPNIEVNHRTLREVALAFATYCSAQDKEMRYADSEIKSMLSSEWIGLDAQHFGGQWEGVDEVGSTAVKFRESLKKFGENLDACAKEYQSAQEDVYNAANWLPRILVW